MESQADFLSYLALVSLRSLCLGLLTWLALHVCRVRSASAKHAVWTVVTAVMLLQAVVSPALPSLPIRVLAPVPDTATGETPRLAPRQIPVQVSDPRGTHLAFTWRHIVIAIYAAVTFALLVQLILGYRFARRLVRRSKPVEGSRVRESERISVPMTVGQIVPAILLPTGWRTWDSAKLQAVLAHEEAHVRRADWAIGVVAHINCCFFWFHPLAWWLKRELAQLAEHACDDLALSQVGDRQQYARVLLEVACAMKSAQGRLVVSMAKETNVRKRMDQILDEARPIPAAFGRRGWVTLLVCSLPLAYLASAVQLAPAQTKAVVSAAESAQAAKQAPPLVAQARPPAPAPIPAPAPAPAANPYLKWLNEEVVYIVSEEERSAFNRFNNDAERQMFIQQFWLRRDPTPGTEANELKEEHYRRIAWANDRLAGWQTDRGSIYIRYGPPDAMDSHGAVPGADPYEQWRYRYIDGLGSVELEFVDRTRTGQYRLNKFLWEKEKSPRL